MTMPDAYPRQGEVWNVTLDPTVGHEQRGRARPCLILSVDRLNEARWVVIVVPMTSSLRPLATRVRVPLGEGGLTSESDIVCEQLRAVDMSRLGARRGQVNRATLLSVSATVNALIAI